MDWANRVAFITGACGGIGSELASNLAQTGAALFLVDMNGEALEAQASQLGEKKAAWATVDVTSKTEVTRAVDACLKTFSRIDFLVNLAGVFGKITPTKELAEEEWDRLVNVNLKSAFLCSQAVLPHMAERRRGRIINMSSDLARRGGVGSLPYISAKAGLMGMTRALALEFAPQGITVNALGPAVIDTPMPRGSMPAEALDRMAQANPMGRIGYPPDVANLIIFLLRDESEYINGQTIFLNGGLA